MKINLEAAAGVLKQDANALAAWVFGSGQGGELRARGDLDLGVLFARPPGLDELAVLRADLQGALGVEEIDIAVLNGAGPVLRFEAVSGRPLLRRDPWAAAAFASLAARECEGELAAARKALRERNSARRFLPLPGDAAVVPRP